MPVDKDSNLERLVRRLEGHSDKLEKTLGLSLIHI